MNALEAIAAGGRFVRDARFGVVIERFAAPPWRRELAALVDAEISKRVGRMSTWKLDHAAPRGTCGHCGDPMKPYTSGTCELCAAARWIALRLGGLTS